MLLLYDPPLSVQYLPSVTKKEELSFPSITWMTWINDFFVVTKLTDVIASALDESLGVTLHLFQSKADQKRPLDVRKWQKASVQLEKTILCK